MQNHTREDLAPGLIKANGRDSPNKLLNEKIWYLIGQLVRLGQPHNIGDDVKQPDWAAATSDPSSSLL